MMFNHSAATKVLSHKQTQRNPNHLAQKHVEWERGEGEREWMKTSTKRAKDMTKTQAAKIICLRLEKGLEGKLETNRIESNNFKRQPTKKEWVLFPVSLLWGKTKEGDRESMFFLFFLPFLAFVNNLAYIHFESPFSFYSCEIVNQFISFLALKSNSKRNKRTTKYFYKIVNNAEL